LWRQINRTMPIGSALHPAALPVSTARPIWRGTASGGFIGNFQNANLALTNDWQIVQTGDFNGDGRDDVLWRHSNGTVTDWLGTATGGFTGNFDNANLALTNDWHLVS
jgi:FG-GAP repeat